MRTAILDSPGSTSSGSDYASRDRSKPTLSKPTLRSFAKRARHRAQDQTGFVSGNGGNNATNTVNTANITTTKTHTQTPPSRDTPLDTPLDTPDTPLEVQSKENALQDPRGTGVVLRVQSSAICSSSARVITLRVVLLAFALLGLYFSHHFVQQFHYRHCKSNVLRVIFLDKSVLCVYLHTFLTSVEGIYSRSFDVITRYMLVPMYQHLVRVLEELLGSSS